MIVRKNIKKSEIYATNDVKRSIRSNCSILSFLMIYLFIILSFVRIAEWMLNFRFIKMCAWECVRVCCSVYPGRTVHLSVYSYRMRRIHGARCNLFSEFLICNFIYPTTIDRCVAHKKK